MAQLVDHGCKCPFLVGRFDERALDDLLKHEEICNNCRLVPFCYFWELTEASRREELKRCGWTAKV